MDINLSSSSSDESTWKVDIEELIAATREWGKLCKSRPFFRNIRGFPFNPKVLPPGVTGLWVKPQCAWPSLRGEADTHVYIHDQLSKTESPTRDGLYVAKVFEYVELDLDDWSYTFIVMEFVTGTPISSIMKPTLWSREMSDSEKEVKVRPFKDRVVHALCFLLSLEPLPDTAPGPVNGGHIQNFVFGRDDSWAESIFDSVEELQDWINEENEKKILGSEYPGAIDLMSEGLKLCYCDFNFDNFLLEDPNDPKSRLTIIDFEHTSWLPPSFLLWALWDKREVYMVEQLTSRDALEVDSLREHAEALHNIHLQRRRR
ncbi:hypothetical protein Daus18300_007397 [Diaporthe australafricana]|uniref:Aminoglycoside phosphotransferase domain-containing protein n=1 Tax=Diaporthe australafricana TaxID=127596 RepID=A0ABR3WNN6_9PEZI